MMSVNGSTAKVKIAELKMLKHKWMDETDNNIAVLAASDSKYNFNKTKNKQHLITKFNTYKIDASLKPDETGAQLEVMQLELGMLTEPCMITKKQVGQCLIASLPDGKQGQLGPYLWYDKSHFSKTVDAIKDAYFNLEEIVDK